MSNEYKDWLDDRVADILLMTDLIDRITEICDSPISGHKCVYGIKNGKKVAFAVWWDSIEKEWRYERREMNNA